jgi:hypothetical protein
MQCGYDVPDAHCLSSSQKHASDGLLKQQSQANQGRAPVSCISAGQQQQQVVRQQQVVPVLGLQCQFADTGSVSSQECISHARAAVSTALEKCVQPATQSVLLIQHASARTARQASLIEAWHKTNSKTRSKGLLQSHNRAVIGVEKSTADHVCRIRRGAAKELA